MMKMDQLPKQNTALHRKEPRSRVQLYVAILQAALDQNKQVGMTQRIGQLAIEIHG